MSHYFLIRLPATADAEVLWHSTESGLSGELNNVSELPSLKNQFAQTQVAILVPGELITLRSIDINGRLTPAVIQSIPYRIEEDLASDIEGVHIAILGKKGDQVIIAAVEHQWMSRWQEWLESAGIHACCWIPDTLALPWQEGQCSALILGEQCLFRHDCWKAGSVHHQLWPLFEAELKEQGLPITGFSAADSDFPEHWHKEHINAPLEKMVIDPGLNLLQGRWQQQAPWKKSLKRLRLAASMGALTILCWFASIGIDSWQLNQQAESYRAESYRLYNQLFPGERVIRLKSQLNEKLTALDTIQATNDGLITLLNSLVPAFEAQGDLQALSLQYDQPRNQLKIEAKADSYDSFSQFREAASQQANINVESLEQQGKQVVGVLVIRSFES